MSEDVNAREVTQVCSGTVQCNDCDYWGEMEGYITPDKPKYIQFVCPKCQAIELVVNFGQ